MKLSKPLASSEDNSQTIGLALMLGVVALLAGLGALNGGTALTSSVWDSLATWLKSMLTSTWVMVLALIVLVAAVWQLAHGGGYHTLGIVLAVLAVALIGPTFLTSMSTATGLEGSISSAPAFLQLNH